MSPNSISAIENFQISAAPRRPFNDLEKIDEEDYVTSLEKNFVPPKFTIKELRDCVPPHLFERSLLKSSTYLVASVFAVAGLFWTATYIDRLAPPLIATVLWPIYWWYQATFAGGLWVIAHECGHQAFCDSKPISNAVGLILHTFLLVPYYGWKISHAKHHAHTGHVELDEIFIPDRRSQVRPSAWREAIDGSPICSLIKVIVVLACGWLSYVTFNAKGRQYPRFTSHFHPSSPLFEPKDRFQIVLSNVALITMVTSIVGAIQLTGFWTVAKYYLIPYLIVNGFVIVITYLQHNDVYVPKYTEKAWTFTRGAICTVDRDYGWLMNLAFHHVGDTHIAHHFFSQMPHYNALKATPYVKERLGEYYFYDRTPLWKAFYRGIHNCLFVEDTGDILFWKK